MAVGVFNVENSLTRTHPRFRVVKGQRDSTALALINGNTVLMQNRLEARTGRCIERILTYRHVQQHMETRGVHTALQPVPLVCCDKC